MEIIKEWGWTAFSALMLVAGVAMGLAGVAWFAAPWVAFLWYLVAVLPVGWPVVAETVEAFKEGDIFNEFLLMVVAAVGAFAIGEYPEGVAVMLFYAVGETLQDRAVDRARGNIRALLALRPDRVRVERGGQAVDCPPEDVRPGDRLELAAGQRLAVDCRLLSPEGVFDTSALTGESLPRRLAAGAEVPAGYIACGGSLRFEALRPYAESATARILRLVEDAAARKAPTELLIRRLARVYTPVVMLLAALVALVPAALSWAGVPGIALAEWVGRALVFLVVACPCALVVSIPLSYFGGIGAASRRGILFKGGHVLDAVTHLGAVVFDKTGTLTRGTFAVERVEAAGGFTPDGLLRLAAAVEARSLHPVAVAVTRAALGQDAALPEASDVEEVAGRGMRATVGGQRVVLGNARFMEEEGVGVPAAETTGTAVYCAVDGRYAGVVTVVDEPRPDAAEAVAALRRLGVAETVVLSGDRRPAVEALAARLGLDKAEAELLPEDKVVSLQRIKAAGRPTAFVGDGINDAPVLAAADVGVAVGDSGSDVAIETADLVLQDGRLTALPEAVALARRTHRIVWQNIVLALGVKVVVMALGAMGMATLWMAVFADTGVALLAVLNAVRILKQPKSK